MTLDSFRSKINSAPVAAVVISILVFLGVYLGRQYEVLQPVELVAYDWLVRVRPTRPVPPRVSLVTITEADLQALGRWPLPNIYLADALRRITAHGPRAVGIDVYTDIPVPPGREQLEQILLSNPRIIAGMRFPRANEPGIPPPSVLADTAQYAFTDWVVDPGGIVRRGLLILDDGESYVFSLALQTALIYLAQEHIAPEADPDNPEHLRLGNTTIPPFDRNFGAYVNADDAGYQYLLGYREDLSSIERVTLQQLRAGDFKPSVFTDRVVLIGVSAESVKDYFYTPYSGADTDSPITPGVVLHAHSVSQLLRFALDEEQPIESLSDRDEALWILLWSLCGGILGLAVRAPARFAFSGFAGLVLMLGIVNVAMGEGLWIPLVPSGLTWLISATIVTAYVSYRDMQERSKLMQLFSRHVAKELAEDIWEHRDQFLTGGYPRPQKLVATVFFSDIVAFSTISEELEPQALMDWLNDYMSLMTNCINEHDGVILRFIGDAIMAVFGVPIARETEEDRNRDAVNAVECALAMQQTLIEHNLRLQADGKPLIAMRVGIFTGSMVAGSIGDAVRVEYNVHGDTVNTAARLEGYQKENYRASFFTQPCRILVGEPTFERLAGRFRTELIGEAKLKGKQQLTTVYRILGRADAQAARLPDTTEANTDCGPRASETGG